MKLDDQILNFIIYFFIWTESVQTDMGFFLHIWTDKKKTLLDSFQNKVILNRLSKYVGLKYIKQRDPFRFGGGKP